MSIGRSVFFFLLLATVAAGAVIIIIMLHHPSSPLPSAITKQVAFIVYYPSDRWQLVSQSASYENGVLTFTVQSGQTTLSLNEQATPDVFNDVSQYYPTLLTKLNEYATIGSPSGTAYLTKPKELVGGQSAVLNSNGTLLFARPNRTLSTREWRTFFNNVRLIKASN